MRNDIRRGLYGFALAAGIAALGSSEASAAETSGTDGVAAGNQITPVITAPVTADGNAITLIGDPTTGSSPDGSSTEPSLGVVDPATTGNDSLAGGNQITPVITASVTVDGNTITLIGDPTTTGSGTGTGTSGSTTPAVDPATTGNDSLAGGNQITPVITAPVTADGNAITLLGDPTTSSSPDGSGAGPSVGVVDATTTGQDSLAGGNQITPVITAPVTADGNAITLLGDPTTSSSPDGSGAGPSVGVVDATTTGQDSLAGGNQITPVITAPVTADGNAITLLGDPTTSSSSGETANEGDVPTDSGDATDEGSGTPEAPSRTTVDVDGSGAVAGSSGSGPDAPVGSDGPSLRDDARIDAPVTTPVIETTANGIAAAATVSVPAAPLAAGGHASADAGIAQGSEGTGVSTDAAVAGCSAGAAGSALRGFLAGTTGTVATTGTVEVAATAGSTGAGNGTCGVLAASGMAPTAGISTSGSPARTLGAALLAVVGAAAIHGWGRLRQRR